jgi:hypothetical protein
MIKRFFEVDKGSAVPCYELPVIHTPEMCDRGEGEKGSRGKGKRVENETLPHPIL